MRISLVQFLYYAFAFWGYFISLLRFLGYEIKEPKYGRVQKSIEKLVCM